ncbi:MAG: hypothetical protein COA73_10870 [Candidatus Hydrogenedentota bacterium]|nr:MAG: hypothetical protein COA73_10870 [Candidatus Hydrogenedentota bacterium]
MALEPDKSTWNPVFRVYALCAAAYAFIALCIFGELLFRTDGTLVSHALSDGSQYFTRMREFGFGELAKGNMPLWNPYIFSGTPFVGAFQTGMFYPFNLVYLVLPISNAFTTDSAWHVFLTGFFMFAWARERGLRVPAAFFAGIVLAYGGACFVRVMAGHITMLQAMSWAPLIFLCIDKLFQRRSLGWILIGTGATTLQILAGHPQTLFMTALAASLYTGLQLLRAENRTRIVITLIPFGIIPPILAAVQLWSGLDVAMESMRSEGVTFDFATSFSFHPENLISLFAPAFFGNMIHNVYWARWAFWDSTVYMGVTGLALAFYGAAYGEKSHKRYLLFLTLLFGVMALGSYTPLYRFLFDYLPGINSFRSPSKFMFPASLFAAMLAGTGIDALIDKKGNRNTIVLGLGLFGTGLSLIALAIWYTSYNVGLDTPFYDFAFGDRENVFFVFLVPRPYSSEVYSNVIGLAIYSLAFASVCCALASLFLLGMVNRANAIYGVLLVGMIEVLVFAYFHKSEFNLAQNQRMNFDGIYETTPGDYRILDVAGVDNSRRNYAVETRNYAVWGYDPVILGRYAKLATFIAGGNKFDDTVTEYAMWGNDPFTHGIHVLDSFEFSHNGVKGDKRLLRLLRCEHIIIAPGTWKELPSYWHIEGAYPRFFLTNQYKLCETPDEIFETLGDLDFDPRVVTILESLPDPAPDDSTPLPLIPAPVTILEEDTDSVSLEIDLDAPSLFIVTDSYSKDWHVKALPGSVQQTYTIQPAYYGYRAIPLSAGHHRFVMEYMPTSYRIGRWISLFSFLAFAGVAGYVLFKNSKSILFSTKQS